jgi:hypothetical protein
MLGMGVFFTPFIPNYPDLVKDLPDMTKPTFNWIETTWKHDYRGQWEGYKLGLQKSSELFYPDYSLDWVLRTDSSDYGISGILMQIKSSTGKPDEYQTIAVCSQKYSAQALRWNTIEKEAYAIYFSVKKFSYYLIGKYFLIETDHNNLRWIEASEVPKIVRWRIYLQSFHFDVQHIKGTKNTVADALSRLLFLEMLYSMPELSDDEFHRHLSNLMCVHTISVLERQGLESTYPTYRQLQGVFDTPTTDNPGHEIAPAPVGDMTQQDLLSSVHNSTEGHWGIAETYMRLNRRYPGHGISQAEVRDFVKACVNCEKTRRERSQRLVPVVRHLKPPHSRSAIGIDGLAITPHGPNGETHILVVINLFTKLVYLQASVGCTAQTLCVLVWTYWCTYGHTDMIISDKGPDLNSTLFEELVKLMGMRHVFSITDKHSNGTERINKEILRHLRAMVYDTRVSDIFSDRTKIPSVQYVLNTHASIEISDSTITPFELTFGSHDSLYSDLLKQTDTPPSHSLLMRLNENLETLRRISHEYQQGLTSNQENLCQPRYS